MRNTQMSRDTWSDEDEWVYLDTDVTRFVLDVFDGWSPSDAYGPGDRERVAAFRVFVYARRPARTLFLTTSEEVERELGSRDSWNRLEALLFPLNKGNPPLSENILQREATRFEDYGVGAADARHAAHASLRPWVHYLVTNDRQFRKRAIRAGLPAHLTIVSPVEAETVFGIQSGESSPISFVPKVASHNWWEV